MVDNLETTPEPLPLYRWDFFLSHSGADFDIAKRFKEALEPPSEVFLDRDDIIDGEIWSEALPKALKSSLVYVFLLSRNTDGSFYVGEEINVAVGLLNENRKTRRVVPIYLNEKQVPKPQDAPFGLGSIQGFALPDLSDLSTAGQRLRDTLQYVKPLEEKKIEFISGGREAVGKINSGSSKEVLAGIKEATKFVRPLFYAALALLVLLTIAIVACLLLAATEKGLKLIVLGILWCFFLLIILWLTNRELGNTGRIANGQVNGG